MGRSGWVTRLTTGWEPASRAPNVGSANVPVPIITRRIGYRPPASGWRVGSAERWASLPLQNFEHLLDIRSPRDVPAFLGAAEFTLKFLHLSPAGHFGNRTHLVDE